MDDNGFERKAALAVVVPGAGAVSAGAGRVAETCTTQSGMAPADRDGIADAARSLAR